MALWIPISLAAALVQTLRFLLQRRLKALGLSTGGATFSRFVFAAPLAWALVLLMIAQGRDWPVPGPAFWTWAVIGGLGQILGTYCTVSLFSMRNFAVGIAFTKTETVQVALFSALFLGEAVSAGGFLAILIGVVGVVLLSWPRGAKVRGVIWNRTLALGLVAGASFALAAIGYRGAALTLGADDYFFRAAFTLACVTTTQTAIMLVVLRLAEPGTLGKVARSWRATALVGLTGMLGSLGWFTAFTLQNAAYVRAFGQVELVFGLAAGVLFLGEKVTRRELAGMAFLGISLLAIVLAS
ncbi:DMT family transporter [Frigidibacter sp. ROC022]|uniref:DMT family transporter n=1 Tax=Frigidibacter sp. ROC022 TaxID=2971796 RepID=UPI00215AC72B|nr:DMT family transporter [Frigidibacter sp. ROC022]MCR8725444.1 DMT family transporter [Frigidibacter sp. ROC022]